MGSASPLLHRIQQELDPVVRARDSLLKSVATEPDASARDVRALDARDTLLKRVASVGNWFYKDSLFQVVVGWPHKNFRADRLQRAARPSAEDSLRIASVADSVRTALRANGATVIFAEGDGYLELDEPGFLEAVRAYTSAPVQAFLQMQVEEQSNPTAGDAALMPWDSLAERLVHADELLAATPHSVVTARLSAMRNSYLALFLTGLSNTPGFTDRTNTILPEHRERLSAYVRANRGTAAAEQITRFLDLLKASHGVMSPGVKAFVDSIRD